MGPLLELSCAPFHCTRPSLNTLWDALWSLGADLSLRRDTSQSVGSSTLRHSQSATLLLGGPLPPIQLPRRLSRAHRQLCWVPPALSWGAVGANLVWTSGFLKKKSTFLEKVLPSQRRCPGQVVCSQKSHFLRKSSAPGSEAARDKWLVHKKVVF